MRSIIIYKIISTDTACHYYALILVILLLKAVIIEANKILIDQFSTEVKYEKCKSY